MTAVSHLLAVMMGSSVKSERHDDQEINELAKKILEQNATKVRQQQQQLQQQQHYAAAAAAAAAAAGGANNMQQAMQAGRQGQPLIHNYLTQAQVGEEPTAQQHGHRF